MKTELLKSTFHSIEPFLNPGIFGDREIAGQISENLVSGRLIVIREAFHETLAERISASLEAFEDWQLHEGYEHYFHYHHHNLSDPSAFPPDLRLCYEIFGSDSTKNFVRQLSHKDCEGETAFSASRYMPGDYSLPHTDSVGEKDQYRQVALCLAPDETLEKRLGGDFFWCAKGRYIPPSFNTLLLFTVGHDSLHFVTHVSPHAKSKRLAVNGWWTGKICPENDPPRGQVKGTENPLVEFV